jgi:hypothetical protein
MSETVEHKPRRNKWLLGAILLALGVLLVVVQIAGAVVGTIAHRVADSRTYQTEVQVEEIAVEAERNAELVAIEAERVAEQAELNAELSAREAERIAEQAEREAERIAEMAERDAERMAAQIERDFGSYTYTVEVNRRSPFFFHPFRPFRPYRGPGLIPLAVILFGVYLLIRQRRAAAPVPQTGPEADHGPAV